MPGSAGATANSELRMSPITNACSGASPTARATVDTVNERPSACTRSSLLKVKRLKVRHRGDHEDARPSRNGTGDKSHERRRRGSIRPISRIRKAKRRRKNHPQAELHSNVSVTDNTQPCSEAQALSRVAPNLLAALGGRARSEPTGHKRRPTPSTERGAFISSCPIPIPIPHPQHRK